MKTVQVSRRTRGTGRGRPPAPFTLIEPSGKLRAPRRFTLVELLVVIAIIAILASMLLPALGSARSVARRAPCMGNQHQVTTAITLWADDHDGHTPDKLASYYGYTDVGGTVGYGPQQGHCSDHYHPVCKLQDYKMSDGIEPNVLGLGVLYTDDYLTAGESYYCTELEMYIHEGWAGYAPSPMGGYNDGCSFLTNARQPKLGRVVSDVYSTYRYYYTRNRSAWKPGKLDRIPSSRPILADSFAWPLASMMSGVMEFAHGNRGAVVSYLDGSTAFRTRPRGSGPGYGTNLAAWLTNSGPTSAAWGVEKGFPVGPKYPYPNPGPYLPQETTGAAASMGAYDWWVHDRR